MNASKYFVILLLLFSIFSIGCKSGKETLRANQVKGRNTPYLIEQVKKNEFNCDWLNVKASVTFKNDKMSDSFKMHVRLRSDSAIWVSVTYYAVEVARLLITTDSVKFMDRKENKYFIGDFNFLNDRFNVDVDFKTIQAILMGNSIGLDDLDKIKSYASKGFYHLSTFKKHKLKKARDHGSEGIAIGNWVNPETFKVRKIEIDDFKKSKSMNIEYLKYDKIEGQELPNSYAMEIITDDQLSLEVTYLKSSVNKPLKFSFKIPEKYAKME